MLYNLLSMTEGFIKPKICLTAIGHDPSGSWTRHIENTGQILEQIYSERLISFTPVTNLLTVSAAEESGWQIIIEDSSIGVARMRGIERALSTSCKSVNLWDGDRVLYAATRAPNELADFVDYMPAYDFSITGASLDAIKTHQSSLTSWEGVKSWYLGYYLGIEGDIANRGCFGFSREFATFLMTHLTGFEKETDEVDGIFPIMAQVFQKFIQNGEVVSTGRQATGYKEYPIIASYEDWIFEGLASEESKRRKNTKADFMKRGRSVLRQIQVCEGIARRFGLVTPNEPSFMDMLNDVHPQ